MGALQLLTGRQSISRCLVCSTQQGSLTPAGAGTVQVIDRSAQQKALNYPLGGQKHLKVTRPAHNKVMTPARVEASARVTRPLYSQSP
jgi:hypothetical protein